MRGNRDPRCHGSLTAPAFGNSSLTGKTMRSRPAHPVYPAPDRWQVSPPLPGAFIRRQSSPGQPIQTAPRAPALRRSCPNHSSPRHVSSQQIPLKPHIVRRDCGSFGDVPSASMPVARRPVPACLYNTCARVRRPQPVGEKISPAGQTGLLAAAALQIFPPLRSSALLRPRAGSR
jgi:hypothetical protein